MSDNVLIMPDGVIMLAKWIGLLIQAGRETRCRGASCLMCPSRTKRTRLTWCFLSTTISTDSTYHSSWGALCTADTASILNGPGVELYLSPDLQAPRWLPVSALALQLHRWPPSLRPRAICTVWNLEYVFIRFDLNLPYHPHTTSASALHCSHLILGSRRKGEGHHSGSAWSQCLSLQMPVPSALGSEMLQWTWISANSTYLQYLWRSTLEEDARQFIKDCPICCQHRSLNHEPAGLLQATSSPSLPIVPHLPGLYHRPAPILWQHCDPHCGGPLQQDGPLCATAQITAKKNPQLLQLRLLFAWTSSWHGVWLGGPVYSPCLVSQNPSSSAST